MFLVDPSLIVSSDVCRAKLSVSRKSYSDTSVLSLSELSRSSSDLPGEMVISPGELGVIRRLSERVNVLPVIARADSLTDGTLATVKEAVRRGLRMVGLDFGVFSTHIGNDSDPTVPSSREIAANGNGTAGTPTNSGFRAASEAEMNKERTSRSVVKSSPSSRNRSHSRRDLSAVAHDEREPFSPEDADEQSVSNVRFSAQALAKADLGELLPFAFIAPEPLSSPRTMPVNPMTPDSKSASARKEPASARAPLSQGSVASPDGTPSRRPVYQHTPPEDLKGVFTRKFRWGTVDVLDPEHCDFAALRTAMLLTHMKVGSLLLRFVYGLSR